MRPSTRARIVRSTALCSVAACLLFATGCGSRGGDEPDIPTAPTATVPLGADVTLAPGDSVVIGQASLTMTFVGVTGDSRCPTNVQCVWGR